MIYKKEEYIEGLMKALEEKDNNLEGIEKDRVYSILNKYIYVPPKKLSDPEVAVTMLNVDEENMKSLWRFSNVIYNFKDCVKDIIDLIANVSELHIIEELSIYNKWLIVANILKTINDVTTISAGKTEFWITYTLHTYHAKTYVNRETLIQEVQTYSNNIFTNMELENAIDNLNKMKCIEIVEDKIRIVELIIVR